MPKGYGQFVTALSGYSALKPGQGISIKEWKRKLLAADTASQPGFDDNDWEIVTTGDRWSGELQHAWYRTILKMPEKIDGFPVEGETVHLHYSGNDRGELYHYAGKDH